MVAWRAVNQSESESAPSLNESAPIRTVTTGAEDGFVSHDESGESRGGLGDGPARVRGGPADEGDGSRGETEGAPSAPRPLGP